MKNLLLKSMMLALVLLGGAVSVWAQKISPDLEILFRTNNDNNAWNSGYPKEASETNNEYEINYFNGFYALQKYTVENLAAVKKLTLNIAGPSSGSGAGQDAVAIWAFSTNDWTSSSDASSITNAVATIVGIAPHVTEGNVNTGYLLNTCGQNRETTDGIQYCHFVIDGEALARLKSAASNNTLTLLITNRTDDLKKNSKRTYYSSGHVTEACRPYIEVNETYPAAIGNTGYETLNAAFDAITTEGTITLYDNISITSRCNSEAKTINVVPVKDGLKITSTLTNSLWFLTQSGATVNIGSDEHQLIIDGNNAENSSCFVEAGNGSQSTTFNNVKFLNCKTSSAGTTGSIICYKSNGGSLILKDLVFEGCEASSANTSLIFYGLNDLNIKGGLTITNCSAAYDIYIENSNTTDKFLKVKEMSSKPSAPVRVYCKTPAVGTLVLSTNYKDMTTWFSIMNDGYGLFYKTDNGDNILKQTSSVTTAPTGKTGLAYTGSSQEIVDASSAACTGGELKYSKTQEGVYGAANTITETNAGTYSFWYKVVGDADHIDTAPVEMTGVVIAKGTPEITAPVGATSLVASGSAQALIATQASATLGATVVYRLGEDGDFAAYNEETLSATNAGAYKVYYRVEETENLNAVEATYIEVVMTGTIQKDDEGENTATESYAIQDANNAQLSGVTVNDAASLEIPASVNGIPVTSIAAGVFTAANTANVQSIDLSNTKVALSGDVRSSGVLSAIPENVIIVLPKESPDASGANVVTTSDGTNFSCSEVKIAETKAFVNGVKEFTTTKFTFDRTFLNGDGQYNTVFLPVDIPAAVKTTLGTFYTCSSVNESGAVLTEVTGDLTANTAYVFKPASGKNKIEVDGQTLTIKMNANITKPTGAGLKGTNVEGTIATLATDASKAYGYAAETTGGATVGAFYKLKPEATVPAYRAWLEVDTAVNGSRLAIIVDGDGDGTTGIISIDGQPVNGGVWYDLNGRKYDSKPSQKGIYIIDGKKIIVK